MSIPLKFKPFKISSLIKDISCVYIIKRKERPLDFLYELEETPKIVNKEIVRFYKYPQFHIQKFVVIHSRIELRMINFLPKSYIKELFSSCDYKELLKKALDLNIV